MSMRIAVGAVYQTLTCCSCRMRYQRSASNSASSTMLVTPCSSGARMPYEVPVTQPGSAVHQNTSSACRSSAWRPVAKCVSTASCTWIAPLGVPVVPLVKCSSAMSEALVSTAAGGWSAACAMSAA